MENNLIRLQGMSHDDEIIGDVMHGQIYKNLINEGKLGTSDISLLLNTDGMSVFKSSNFSIWPILATINELPFHLRKGKMLLAGLWFGSVKPYMNTFFKPFMDEMSQLGSRAILLGKKYRKVFCLFLSTDAPARAIVRNCKQFNGAHGCDWCEQEGDTIENGNGPDIRVYPYKANVTERNDLSQRILAIKCVENGSGCETGVKGPSFLMKLPNFDCARRICCEMQHAAFLGVVRQFLDTWLDSRNKDKDYYLKRKITLLDEKLTSIAPPSDISRCPRSVKHRKYWKASEFRAFLLYSLVVLQDLLPGVYLNHWFLFVRGMYTLMGEEISVEDVHLANACLRKFVLLNQKYYGGRHCTFNVHTLCHFANSVLNCGPLLTTSTFVFEGYNCALGKLFKGTQKVPLQITKTFLLMKDVWNLANECLDENDNPHIFPLYNRMTKGHFYSRLDVQLTFSLRGLGKQQYSSLPPSKIVAIQNLVGRRIVKDVVSYVRFLYKHQLFASSNYTRGNRHCNSFVKCTHHTYSFGQIDMFCQVRPAECSCCNLDVCSCGEFVVLLKAFASHGLPKFSDHSLGCSSNFIARVQATNRLIAVHPINIVQKCIAIRSGGDMFLCVLPGRFYYD